MTAFPADLEAHFAAHDQAFLDELFAFLRGAFVARKDVCNLRSKFLSTEYLGNGKIPEPASEHYLFAGEAGHRKSFAQHLLRRDGRYSRQMTEAFDAYERDDRACEKRTVAIRRTSTPCTCAST